jgi:hypothetical protein
MLSGAAYVILLPPATAVLTVVFYYCIWMSWEMFINN